MACIREYPPPRVYVSLLDKSRGDSNWNLAFDLSITGCQPGVWEATGTISAVDVRIIFQSSLTFVTSVNVLITVLL